MTLSAPGRFLQLQGSWIKDRQDFYLAIGEAINGPRGYFGGDLDTMEDCLSGGFGAQPPFTIVWDDADVSREHLGCYFDKLVEVFIDNKVDVHHVNAAPKVRATAT